MTPPLDKRIKVPRHLKATGWSATKERFKAAENELVYQGRIAKAMEQSGWRVERSPRCWVPAPVRKGYSVGLPDLWVQLRRGQTISGDWDELQRRGIHTMVFEIKKSEETKELNGGGYQATGYMIGYNYKTKSGKEQKLLKRPDVAVLACPEFLIHESTSSRNSEAIKARLHLAERIFWKRGCMVLKIQGNWVGFETNIGHDTHTFVRLFENDWLFA